MRCGQLKQFESKYLFSQTMRVSLDEAAIMNVIEIGMNAEEY
jgi:hypothetical protein